MDGHRFDELTKRFAAGTSRRRVLKGLAAGVAGGMAAVLGRSGADAQTQVSCGNVICAGNPGVCSEGCVCCVFGNGNSRCLAPATCQRLGGEVETACSEGQPCATGNSCPGYCLNGACVDICSAVGKTCVDGTCQNLIGFSQPPDVVWRALTDRRALTAWAMDNDFKPVVGRRFQLRAAPRAGFDGVMEGEVVAVEPGRRLSFTWRGGSLTTPTAVTLTLEPEGEGTRLRLDHSSPDNTPCLAARELLGRDWTDAYFRRALSRHLTRG